ncbi:MAG: glutamate synthase [Peptococcaceae bacterium]|nr:glutamate synthase [Peptococcaceae bacterium]
MIIDARGLHFRALNDAIKGAAARELRIENCLGQRYIAGGLAGKEITIVGTPGNALGAYMDGSRITVMGNAQDATGDTMNDGEIRVFGSAGDATGYAMRGGHIYVRGSIGYRAGIHMKEYQEKSPVLVVGQTAGSFLGEYQAGGTIIVLGLDCPEDQCPVGPFCATGMHGGRIYIRGRQLPRHLPGQVAAREAGPEDLAVIRPWLTEFARLFDIGTEAILSRPFLLLTPDTKNPYKQLYTLH